jgi:hypothetical protein
MRVVTFIPDGFGAVIVIALLAFIIYIFVWCENRHRGSSQISRINRSCVAADRYTSLILAAAANTYRTVHSA